MIKLNATESVLKDGTLRVEEYDFRPIDKNGDVIDPQMCDTMEEAMKYAAEPIGAHPWPEQVAWVIDKHVSYHPAHHAPRGQDPDNYTKLAHGGDEAALREGGWLEN